MSHDRRDFLKLVAAALATMPGTTTETSAQRSTSDPPGVIPIHYKGQVVLVRHKKGQEYYMFVGLLKAKVGQVQHLGWLAIQKRQVDRFAGDARPESIGDYWVWPLGGELRMDGAVAVPPAASVKSTGAESPDDPDVDSHWSDPRWIVDMREVSPKYELVADWQDGRHYTSSADYQGRFDIVGHRPCRALDATAIWSLANEDGEITRQSMTDRCDLKVSFTGIAEPMIEQRVAMRKGAGPTAPRSFQIWLKVRENPELHLISAPRKRTVKAGAAMAHATHGGKYKYGDPLKDFGMVYNILKGGTGAIPRFLKKHVKPANDLACNEPMEAKDLDIFCPPAQMDAP